MSNALSGFETQKSWVDQLADIHGRISTAPGRRQQEALYRAGAILTVAAWESFIEDVLNEAVQALAPGANASVGERTGWAFAQASARQATKKFNTPSAHNVNSLIEPYLGIDLSQAWGITVNSTAYSIEQAKTRINSWLDIRHKLAHGGALPRNLNWIKSPSGKPRLTLFLMRDCRDFFWTLARESDTAVSTHLVNHFGLSEAPW